MLLIKYILKTWVYLFSSNLLFSTVKCIVEQDTASAIRLKIAENPSSFHFTLATLGHKYLLGFKPCYETTQVYRGAV